MNPNDLQYAPCRNWYFNNGNLHDLERDIAMYWERTFVSEDGSGEERKRIALLGIENQTAYDKNMPLRIAGYDGADLRSQYNDKGIYAVLTLVLNYGASSWDRCRSGVGTMSSYVPKILKKEMSNTPIRVVNLRKLSDRKISQFTSDFRHVAQFVRHVSDKNYRMTDLTELCHPAELFNFLSVIRKDPRYAHFNLEMERGPKSMCEYYDRILEEGRVEGREEGDLLATIRYVRTLVESLGRGPEEVLDLMGVFGKERRSCLSALRA